MSFDVDFRSKKTGFLHFFKYKIPKEIYHKLPFTVPDDVDDLTVEFNG